MKKWIIRTDPSFLAILRNKIEEKRRFEKEIKQLSEELKSLESDVHLIEMVVSMKSKDEPTYSLDVLENHFIQNEMYLGKHKDIKRELDMKYEQIKRLKENIYSRQRFIDNLSSQK